MKNENDVQTTAPTNPPNGIQETPGATPHMTIISHSDNEHKDAGSIIAEILHYIDVFEPLVISIISSQRTSTFTVPGSNKPQ